MDLTKQVSEYTIRILHKNIAGILWKGMDFEMKEDLGTKLALSNERWNKRIRKWVTPRTVAIFTTVVYVCSLIPLLWIAWYNYPSADDYAIGSNCHQAWMATHNVFMVIWQGIVRAADDWAHWMGYFTSNFLMAIPPSSFGERGYILTTWIMLGMLSFSVMYLFRAIFVKAFKADKMLGHSVSMLVLFASVQCMCPAGRCEAFYWYSGAANYIFVHSMSLFFFGLLISAVYDCGKKRIWDLVAASFLGFLVGGGNQMSALNGAIVLLTAVVLISICKNWNRCRALAAPMGIFYVGFVLNVAAPGNWVRAKDASGMNPIKAVFVSFYDCLDRAMNQWTTWSVIILMIALIPLFWHMADKIAFRFPCPLAVLLFGFCLTSAMITPPIFAVGNMEAGRLQALVYLMYILTLSLGVGYLTGWTRKRWVHRQSEDASGSAKQFSAESCWCLAGCVLFLLFGSVLTIIPEPHYYTFSSALTDLSNGNAKAYGDTLKARMEIYRGAGEGIIEVEPLPAQPVLLYFSDIKEDPEDWENKGLARYYGFEGVAVKKN